MSDLAKLTITPKEVLDLGLGFKEIKVLFNPNTYSIVKGVSWTPVTSDQRNPCGQPVRGLNAPELQFAGGQGRTLSLDLFFDTTEETDDSKVDVRNLTNKIVKLTRIVRALKPPRPPVCEVAWGKAPPQHSDFPFNGVISQLTQHFNLFRDDGSPVRANLTVAFQEWLPSDQDQKETDPEFTTRLVKRGDTLSSIAAAVYRDPSLWRVIAEVNRLDDPRQIQIGQRLSIPRLR